MPKKQFKLCYCMDCKEEFITVGGHLVYYCPLCGEDWSIEEIRTFYKLPYHQKNKFFTKKEDQTIIYGRTNGATWQEIADSLNRSLDSVTMRGVRLRKKGLIP